MFEDNEIAYVRGNSFQILNSSRIEKFLKTQLEEVRRHKDMDSKAKGKVTRLRTANGLDAQLGKEGDREGVCTEARVSGT